jgi:hypothetical protein
MATAMTELTARRKRWYPSGGIAGRAGGILFHGAEAGSHALEGVIGKELE